MLPGRIRANDGKQRGGKEYQSRGEQTRTRPSGFIGKDLVDMGADDEDDPYTRDRGAGTNPHHA